MPLDGDFSVNFEVKNSALVRGSTEEDDDMDDVEEEKLQPTAMVDTPQDAVKTKNHGGGSK